MLVKMSKKAMPIPNVSGAPPPFATRIYTDAAGGDIKSNNGMGGVKVSWEGNLEDPFYLRWPEGIQRGEVKSMCVLELAAALGYVTCYAEKLRGKFVVVFIDNIASVLAWRRGFSKMDGLSSTIAKAFVYVAAAQRITLFTLHVTRCSNKGSKAADMLSKGATGAVLEQTAAAARIIEQEKWPRVPRALQEWFQDPRIDNELGPRINEEIQEKARGREETKELVEGEGKGRGNADPRPVGGRARKRKSDGKMRARIARK